jgi:hypothetical protein
MIWDAKSKGTLNNVLNLLRLEKKILVYLAPTQSFQTVRTADDLHNLLAMCERQDVVGFEQELSLQQFFTAMRPQLAFNLVESDVAPEKVVAL